MSGDAKALKIYEAHVLKDALARLAKRFDLKSTPLSGAEVQTLNKRTREAMWSTRKKERLAHYKAHLSTLRGEEPVRALAAALQEIHNEIGYEEK
jgi:hypothetical protein